ncbi:DNA double-strand break repair nuclease NurA [Thermocoleostomius sinensis]|uniref:DNA double-strand break repair nuclease NurA n=1 Tax=Thermocoleostomius sinensis A174 TaxID=2016057 RepID=A0A9E9C991_9CYAN|nr:DNA double-strand break repair nuclease NurA [Thermocoleostomius sinensis]WAL61248.1 DNA double-strand break repair nuclease NurA [Thermocoleostomius sinensis A174]
MPRKEIPDSAIELVAKHINTRSNKNYSIPVVGHKENIETPQIFEIISFDQIDDSDRRFYAIDGSYNSEQFYNGLCIAIYAAGYICFHRGQQIRMNSLDDPVILGKAYYPQNILITHQEHLDVIYDEFLTLEPVKKLLDFLDENPEEIFPYKKEQICTNLSTLLGFCQEVLEISLVLEIVNLTETKPGDFILRDGTLRPLQIKQKYLVKLGKYAHEKGVKIIAVTKQSPIKMELAYTFKQIDNYLQDQLKHEYPFVETDPKRKKLCCWLEVPDVVLKSAYQGDMFIKKSTHGGRGFGLFFAARLDYVEKLQNYDWLIVDVNIFDAIPQIESNNSERDAAELGSIFKELTRLTQEHYILGYPYPLCEVHNFISLKKHFKEEIIARLKYSLYRDQRMDNVDIENLFLNIHERF